MIKKAFFMLWVLCLWSCAIQKPSSKPQLSITSLIEKENINVRALEIYQNRVFFAGGNGWVGEYDINTDESFLMQLDSTQSFRALGVTSKNNAPYVYLMNIESPAYVWEGSHWHTLRKSLIDDSPKAFFDAMAFNSNGEGFALGDPVENCMSLIHFSSNGHSQIPCNRFITALEGEAAFAASNSNIKMMGHTIWIATGGVNSRIYKSTNMGKTWKAYTTPIIQGKPSQGIYAIDFYNQKIGIAIGGDYTKPNEKFNNLIKTSDGGKTWKAINHPTQPSYRSCIRYVPESKGKKIIAVGFKGIDFSVDGGNTWVHLSDESLYTIRFIDKHTAFAAGKNGIYLLKLNK